MYKKRICLHYGLDMVFKFSPKGRVNRNIDHPLSSNFSLAHGYISCTDEMWNAETCMSADCTIHIFIYT